MKDWPEGTFSEVTITFKDAGDDNTEIVVDQQAVPEYDHYNKAIHITGLEEGWRNMIFKRIEQVFGYPIKK